MDPLMRHPSKNLLITIFFNESNWMEKRWVILMAQKKCMKLEKKYTKIVNKIKFKFFFMDFSGKIRFFFILKVLVSRFPGEFLVDF
jgi:hypothetical protein